MWLIMCVPPPPFRPFQAARAGKKPRTAMDVGVGVVDSLGLPTTVTVINVTLDRPNQGWNCGSRRTARIHVAAESTLLATLRVSNANVTCAQCCRLAAARVRILAHKQPLHAATPSGPCRTTPRNNCSCVPNAMLLPGGFRIMPQWRRNTRPGALTETIIQV